MLMKLLDSYDILCWKGKMLPNWKKPHITLLLTFSAYTLFIFTGTFRSKAGVNGVL
jgi:hypothetical protein